MGSMSTKAKVIVLIVAIAVFMGIGAVGYRKMEGIFNPKKAEPEITTTIVSRQLQTMQDLTTAKENDYGFEEFSEGNIAHVNKKKFTMFYSYEIRAGVDLAKAGIKVHGRHSCDFDYLAQGHVAIRVGGSRLVALL